MRNPIAAARLLVLGAAALAVAGCAETEPMPPEPGPLSRMGRPAEPMPDPEPSNKPEPAPALAPVPAPVPAPDPAPSPTPPPVDPPK